MSYAHQFKQQGLKILKIRKNLHTFVSKINVSWLKI